MILKGGLDMEEIVDKVEWGKPLIWFHFFSFGFIWFHLVSFGFIFLSLVFSEISIFRFTEQARLRSLLRCLC
jgi:hypothetical protein